MTAEGRHLYMSAGSTAAYLLEDVPSIPSMQQRGILQITIGYDAAFCKVEHILDPDHSCIPFHRAALDHTLPLNSDGTPQEFHYLFCDGGVGQLCSISEGRGYEKNSFYDFLFRGRVKRESAQAILKDLSALHPAAFPWYNIDRRGAVSATRSKLCSR